MKASWEKIEKNLGVLEIEVDVEQVAGALDKAFKKVVGKVNVPGFRKGKVPRRMFEARFGVESLYQDALDILLPEAYMQAVEETGIEPIDRPEVDFETFEHGQPFKFTAKVQVKPEVTLGEYKGLELEERVSEVTEEELDAEIGRRQERHAELIVLEEGQAELGDVAVIDFEGFVDGEAFDGGKGENHSLELGSNSFIPGFEEQVVGMSKDEEKDIEVSFPESYHAEALAGKPAVFKVKLHDIKRKKLPELDDEFAMDVSEFETFAEYKEDIKQHLQEHKNRDIELARESEITEKAVQVSEVEIPEIMIEQEQEQMMQEFSSRLRMQGMNLEMYMQFSGQDEAALKEQMKDNAETRVRANLVLEAIAKAEKITASDEEVKEELARMAPMYQMEVEKLEQTLEKNGQLELMKSDLAIRKTIQFLLEHSKSVPAADVAKKADKDAAEGEAEAKKSSAKAKAKSATSKKKEDAAQVTDAKDEIVATAEVVEKPAAKKTTKAAPRKTTAKKAKAPSEEKTEDKDE